MNAEMEQNLQRLAPLLKQRVDSEVTGPLEEARLDVRFHGDGGFRSKIRAETSQNETVSVPGHAEIDLVLISLDGQRTSVGSE